METPPAAADRSLPSTGASIDRRAELEALLHLAGPLVAAQLGNQMLNFVDAAMVGRLGAAALAGVGIGNAVYFTLAVVGLGCVLGTDPLIAQAIGAGERWRARRILDGGVRVALLVGAPLTLAVALAPLVISAVGVEPAVATETRRYLLLRSLNVIPFLLFNAQRSYLQARGATWPIFLSMIVANAVNFVGNYLLIYGDAGLSWLHLSPLGLPALGTAGSAIASTVASLAAVGIGAAAIRALDGEDGDSLRPPPSREPARDTREVSRIFVLGVPLGLQLLAEVGVFALASVMAGRMSRLAAAGNQVAITLASVTFTVCVGIGAATSVRVGRHVGAGDARAARQAGLLGVAISLAWMSFTALVFVVAPAPLARLITSDPSVVAAAVPLLIVAALFQLSDGTQATAAGALRGAGDTVASFVANLLGHWLVGLPIAVLLGFTYHLGATGLWIGLSVGLTAVAVALVARFVAISARPIARV